MTTSGAVSSSGVKGSISAICEDPRILEDANTFKVIGGGCECFPANPGTQFAAVENEGILLLLTLSDIILGGV